MLSPRDLTYREIAGELGISQGSLGPERSRCLGCLRRLLTRRLRPWTAGKERRQQATGEREACAHGHERDHLCGDRRRTPSRSSSCSTCATRVRPRCTATTASSRSPRPWTTSAPNSAGACVLVARLGDEVVGSVRGAVDEDGTAAIAKLIVHPRLQRHGLGGRLLDAVEQHFAGERAATGFRLLTGPPQRGQPAAVPQPRLRAGGHRAR